MCVISMDAGLREELNSIIEKLTHSGLPSLNQDLLKKLKRLCKYVVNVITFLYDLGHLKVNTYHVF